jgi:predicted peroxiredoxin
VASKAVINLTTGLEDPERVTVAFLVAVAAAEQGRPTLMFYTKEAVRLALYGVAQGVACEGCPSLPDLTKRYEAAGGRYLVCPICFNAKHLDDAALVTNASLGGTVRSAISRFDRPWARSPRTSTSRLVRPSDLACLRVTRCPAAVSTACAASASSRPALTSARSRTAASYAPDAWRCGRGSIREW